MEKQKGRSKAEYTKLLLTEYFDRETRLQELQKPDGRKLFDKNL